MSSKVKVNEDELLEEYHSEDEKTNSKAKESSSTK